MPIGGEDAIHALEEALRLTPGNVPLRVHYTGTLLAYGRTEDAETALRDGIDRNPDHVGLKSTLARAYLQMNKTSHAIVILEELVARGGGNGISEAALRVMHARALIKAGNLEEAATQYKKAISLDEEVDDEELAEKLDVYAEDSIYDEGEEEEERLRVGNGPRPAGEPIDFSTGMEKPDLSFADVGGMERVKEEIRMKIIYPLTHAETFKAYGKAVGGGILLYGPPGCGKTHLARATAGEVDARFIAVGISDVLNMWLGESERNLHELFEQARANTPCVLFFDEVDALGASRTDMRQSAGRQLVNQFLAELDGVTSNNEGLLILAATNAPWHIDPAFRRPGRFDRIVFVPPPDLEAREAICRIMLVGKPTSDPDHRALAKKTEGFSGADLNAMIDIAIEAKLKEVMSRSGPPIPEPLRTRDLLAAAKTLKATTREWFSTAKNHALYANQGGLYDDVLDYLKLR